jgi:hypothetical protein
MGRHKRSDVQADLSDNDNNIYIILAVHPGRMDWDGIERTRFLRKSNRIGLSAELLATHARIILFYISSLSQTLMSKKLIVLLQCQTYFQFATYPRIGNV